MKQRINNFKIDFSQGPVWRIIVAQAIPLTIAQFVQLLYNLVDRIYIGHIGDDTSIALTGVGLTFPVITLIIAFTSLFGMGGIPPFSMARGAGKNDEAEKILGNSFTLLIISSVIIMIIGYIFRRPILFLLGASDSSYIYAEEYLKIYLIGTPFSMLTTGLNGYIIAQGFPVIGMLTILLGAVINIILDPIFIFALGMGVSGAALATIISQSISVIWVLRFITGKKALLKLKKQNIKLNKNITKNILKLGTSNFVGQGTSCFVQIACNSTLQIFGGDVYVGIMTVVNSVREIFTLPASSIFSGSQPVISFNYGAKKNDRVKTGIRFSTLTGAMYTLIAWLLIIFFPTFWFKIFSDDSQIITLGIDSLKIYFFGFVFMAFQFAGQSVFQAFGDARHAIFFSLLRKAIIVVPLTFILPRICGLGVNGVFLAEPISNVLGGLACYTTMRMTAYKRLQ